MQIQTKCMRPNLIVDVLFFGGLLFVWGPNSIAESPMPQVKAKQVPAYVAAQFDKPKTRSVHANKATVRSGPSEKYYATTTLLKRASVDVYMETSDGWSGIRPPAGSHNWIPSNIAYLLPGGKSAEIIEDKSPAWVGSDSSDVSEFMWQLELVKSQLVQVLGEELQMADGGKKQLWYRIAPPPGEFRWVKTSQLSDSTPNNSLEDGVRLANYIEEPMPNAVPSKPTPAPGKLVWSDEKQTLEQVERQIQREQAEIQSKMAAEGIQVNLDAPTIEGKSRSNKFKTASNTTSLLNIAEEEPVELDSYGVDDSSANTITQIRPIAVRPHKKRTSASTEHQVDGQRQWEAMQSTDPRLRVRPVNSLLGLIGLNIIEADRAPVTTSIAQQYHTTTSQGNIGRIGTVGNSRLDRLPRPGQFGTSSQRGSTITIPQDPSSNYGTTMGQNYDGMNSVPIPSGAPMHQGESTFSRWLNSREPIFGSTPIASNPTLVANNFGNPQVIQQQPSPIPLETSAWHGLNPSLRNSTAQSIQSSISYDNSNHDEDPEQFQTPEIQSALVHLTREVARPTEQWNFSELKNQASSWVENGTTAMVRGEARLLIERIERFESLRQRTLGFARDTSMLAQQSIGNTAPLAVRPASAVSPISATNPGANGGAVANAFASSPGTDGDASGWLVQVHTTIKGQPEFALTDDAGKVIAYVQSTPSLNLRRYLQQPVTVYGTRGYIPNLAAKQILAERVVRMR